MSIELNWMHVVLLFAGIMVLVTLGRMIWNVGWMDLKPNRRTPHLKTDRSNVTPGGCVQWYQPPPTYAMGGDGQVSPVAQRPIFKRSKPAIFPTCPQCKARGRGGNYCHVCGKCLDPAGAVAHQMDRGGQKEIYASPYGSSRTLGGVYVQDDVNSTCF